MAKTVKVKGHERGLIKPYRIYLYSPYTLESYSASPGDYWDVSDEHIFEDSEGNEMWLMGDYGFNPLKDQQDLKVLKRSGVTVKDMKKWSRP